MVTSFKDLGKSTRELFDKHFKFGFLNFEFRTKTKDDVSITCGGTHDTKGQQFSGYVESKIKPSKGVSLRTAVDSAWVITSDLEIEKKLHPDLSHNITATAEAESGKKTLAFRNKFKHDLMNVTFDVNFKSRYPQLIGAFVVPVPQFKHIVLGAQAVVDTDPFKLKRHVYAIGFKHDDLRVHSSLTDNNDVDVTLYQERKNVEIGVNLGWRLDTKEKNYGAVVQYKPSSKSRVKVKVDQDCLIGLSYRLKMSSDAELTLCMEMNGKDLTSGGHRYGLVFEYDD